MINAKRGIFLFQDKKGFVFKMNAKSGFLKLNRDFYQDECNNFFF